MARMCKVRICKIRIFKARICKVRQGLVRTSSFRTDRNRIGEVKMCFKHFTITYFILSSLGCAQLAWQF